MNNYIAIFALLSLICGFLMYRKINKVSNSSLHVTVYLGFTWIFISMFPVLLIYAFFSENNFTGTIMNITIGGAFGAFFFIWLYGIRLSVKALNADLFAKLASVQSENQQLRWEIGKVGKKHRKSIQKFQYYAYRVKGKRRRHIVLIAANLADIKCVDVWVNSENTHMQMARYYDGSVSALIRYLGAKKNQAGDVEEDIIATDLAKQLTSSKPVKEATVYVTSAGELGKTHNVKKIVHVASVRGQVGFGYKIIDGIENCVTNALDVIESDKYKNFNIQSILFPLLGTGTAEGNIRDISPKLINKAITHFEQNKDSCLNCICFLTWTRDELDVCKNILNQLNDVNIDFNFKF